MSRKTSDGVFLIEPEPAQPCELCGAHEECRPYGPNGEQVCFACGMKDEDACDRAIQARLHGPAEEADA